MKPVEPITVDYNIAAGRSAAARTITPGRTLRITRGDYLLGVEPNMRAETGYIPTPEGATSRVDRPCRSHNASVVNPPDRNWAFDPHAWLRQLRNARDR